MKRIIVLIIVVYCSFFNTYLGVAQIINVPADQPTIQAGIDSATDGDTVLVADGIYIENVNFNTKAITLASHFIVNEDTNHINNTIIDGNQNGATITLDNGEDTTSVICGFTITGGTGLYVAEFDMIVGGGIATNSAGVKVLSNKIINNEVNHSGYAAGGGIGCLSEDVENWLVAKDNIISGNSCYSDGIEALGGGVYSGTDLVFEDNKVFDNMCTGINNAEANAGGIVVGTPSRAPTFNIRSNLINSNHCEGYTVFGCGVMLWYSEGMIIGNEISNNSGSAEQTAQGGGMALHGATGTVNLLDNEFLENNLEAYHVQGGAIQISESNAKVNVNNNTFKFNSVNGSNLVKGGGIMLTQNQEISIVTNLFQGNSVQGGMNGGAGICGDSFLAGVEIKNNEFISNNGFDGGYGGGISLFNAVDVNMEIDGNLFMNNSISNGGGLYTYNCFNLKIMNNVFTGNEASETGGAIRQRYLAKTHSVNHPLVINNTFHNNTSNTGGAIYCDHQDEVPFIVNSIFLGNTASAGSDIYYLGDDTIQIAYCNINDTSNTHIYGNFLGINNINVDPLFVDSLCHLDSLSPCLNKGIDSIYLEGIWNHAPLLDLEGNPRPDTICYLFDLGAYERQDCYSVNIPIIGQSTVEFHVNVYPNPFSTSTTIKYELQGPETADITIVNHLGQIVESTRLGNSQPGKQQYVWNASGMPAGIYFVQVKAGHEVTTRKMIKQ